jgi:hypothetical protein
LGKDFARGVLEMPVRSLTVFLSKSWIALLLELNSVGRECTHVLRLVYLLRIYSYSGIVIDCGTSSELTFPQNILGVSSLELPPL